MQWDILREEVLAAMLVFHLRNIADCYPKGPEMLGSAVVSDWEVLYFDPQSQTIGHLFFITERLELI